MDAMTALARMKCLPCEGGVPKLSSAEIAPLAAEVPRWDVVERHHLHRIVKTREFVDALDLATRIGRIAEKAGHHPDLLVAYGRLEITVFTHSIGGLSQSDFILAAKIDEVLKLKPAKRNRKS
jgi:4a-hydroxytetrahydrobiopterin dehydratase